MALDAGPSNHNSTEQTLDEIVAEKNQLPYSPGISTIQEQVDPSGASEQDSREIRERLPEAPPRRNRFALYHVHTQDGKQRIWRWGFFKLRPDDDNDEQDWWFASTAIPLLAATAAPLANVLSIAALVTSWRANYDPAVPTDALSVPFPDPHWAIAINGASLACGFVGNFFLLLNFARRIRYLVALPMSIFMWYVATGLLMGGTIYMNEYAPPIRPGQTYTQGFWYAIISTVLYLFCSMILMVNMWGYFLGHYPQHFVLTGQQRTLILQTMVFFFWLAMGGAIFSNLNDWSYADALYFSDVTILTVGFGDFFATNDVARGVVFPYSVGGIIVLGLMANSIRKFAKELSRDKVILAHIEKQRVRTQERSVTRSLDLPDHQRPTLEELALASPASFAPMNLKERALTFDAPSPNRDEKSSESPPHIGIRRSSTLSRIVSSPGKVAKKVKKRLTREKKLVLLKEERDRFEAMRKIQSNTARFKRWYNLCISVIAFGLLWCVGAVVFMIAEHQEQGLTYFQALYFCYVSLLTIGYGDLSPKSNAGKPFFVVWSLVAVPTMTILISDMGDTVIRSIKDGTDRAADWTVLPKDGIWRSFLERHQWILDKLQTRQDKKAADKRVENGFQLDPEAGDRTLDSERPLTLEELALEEPTERDLARRLSTAIRKIASHLNEQRPRRYTYLEWVQITRLIRFTKSEEEDEEDEETKGLIEWDWIGDDSPMMSSSTEPEWVLDRLTESLSRYMHKTTSTPEDKAEKHKRRHRSTIEERDFDHNQTHLLGPTSPLSPVSTTSSASQPTKPKPIQARRGYVPRTRTSAKPSPPPWRDSLAATKHASTRAALSDMFGKRRGSVGTVAPVREPTMFHSSGGRGRQRIKPKKASGGSMMMMGAKGAIY